METTFEYKGRNTASWILRSAAVIAAALVFALYYLKHQAEFTWYTAAVSFVTLALFTAILWFCAPKLVRVICGENEFAPRGESKRGSFKVFLFICLGAIALHLVTFFLGVLFYKLFSASSDATFEYCFRTAWMKSNTDARHYLNIAENWYRPEGNDKLLIVFLPMFPVLIRALNLATNDSFISAQIINYAATVLASGMMYLTLVPVIGEKRSRLAPFIALLLPGAIFLNSPMTEPLFLLFTVCAFFFMQKRLYVPAGVFVAFAGFTRSLGVLAAIPLALIGIGHIVSLVKEKQEYKRTLAALIIGLVVSTFGTLGYLAINHMVFGNCLKFFEFQKSNWFQEMCPFIETARYVTRYLVEGFGSADGMEKVCALWGPQLIAILASLAIVLSKSKKLPASYTLYFLFYFAVAIGCTWLLSSVRYLAAALPLIAALSDHCDSKLKTAIVFILLPLLYAAYIIMYMMRLGIY